MPFGRRDLAEALLVVADGGFDGIEYDGAVSAFTGGNYLSRRMRWSLRPSRKFTAEEFRQILALAAANGFVHADDNTDRLLRGEYAVDAWRLHLTLEGHFFAERYGTPTLHAWLGNLRDNLPTLAINAAVAITVTLVAEFLFS